MRVPGPRSRAMRAIAKSQATAFSISPRLREEEANPAGMDLQERVEGLIRLNP